MILLGTGGLNIPIGSGVRLSGGAIKDRSLDLAN